MNFIDFHTHLDCYQDFFELRNQLCKIEGIIVSSSMDRFSYKKNIFIAEEIQNLNHKVKIIPTLGIHPKKAELELKNLSLYKNLLNSSELIGEIGMDFCWYKDVSAFAQEKVFRFFLEHCENEKKYCVIHTKNAEEKICRILEDYPNAKPIIHWYDGPEDIFEEFIHRNYMQTFGCQTIYSKHIQKLLLKTPLNLILAETDNPDSEIWLGGTDSSIFLIKRIYEDIAKILGVKIEDIIEIINSNSLKILKKDDFLF